MEIKFENIPKKPGVYMWLDKAGNILYIGKAKHLQNRMKQYFKGMYNSYKTFKLVQEIVDYKYIITSNEKEALILERNLIQDNIPPYNILLTDDKRYPYIRVKLNKELSVDLVYRINQKDKKSIYFGPFPIGYGAKKLTSLIQRLVTYEKGLLIKDKSKEYWESKFHYAKKLLSSKNSFLIKELNRKMEEAANNFQYEVAQEIKENIEIIKYNQDKQFVEIDNKENIDVIAFIESENFLFISMLFYRMGILLSKKQKVLAIISDKQDLIRQFIWQYYKLNIKPDLLISNEFIETNLKILIPNKGKKKRILEIAIKNAKDNMQNRLSKFKLKEKRTLGATKKLQQLLKLKNLVRIIMIDNSSTNNTNPVSGIVSYVNGVKNKSEYRKFKITNYDKLGDVQYMRYSLEKYFSKNRPKIDLLIVDGGKAQINVAKKVIPPLIKIVGLVKDEKHKTKKLLDENGQFIKVNDNNLWLFLTEMQIEVDRFVKAYHINRRKSSLEGILVSIKGIGRKTEEKLLDYFKSYANIYNASLLKLEKVVSPNIAKKIKELFHENFSDIR